MSFFSAVGTTSRINVWLQWPEQDPDRETKPSITYLLQYFRFLKCWKNRNAELLLLGPTDLAFQSAVQNYWPEWFCREDHRCSELKVHTDRVNVGFALWPLTTEATPLHTGYHSFSGWQWKTSNLWVCGDVLAASVTIHSVSNIPASPRCRKLWWKTESCEFTVSCRSLTLLNYPSA